ncbi:MAG: hypothetical protein ACLVLH_23110 [Eisenbergiella massiliensis]
MQYKKYGLVLLLSNLLVVTAWLCVRGVEINTIASRQAFRASVMEDIADFQETSVSTVVQAASSISGLSTAAFWRKSRFTS